MHEEYLGMINFEELSRTIMTRNLVFDRSEMAYRGIKRIYNSTGTADGDNTNFFQGVSDIERGSRMLVEKAIRSRVGGSPLVIISAIIFTDVVSMNKFLISFGEIYKGHDIYFCLVN